MNISRINPFKDVGSVSSKDCKKVKSVEVNNAEKSIVVSGQAREAATVKMAINATKAAPEIRIDKVNLAIKNINDPAYLALVIDDTAEKIMETFGF